MISSAARYNHFDTLPWYFCFAIFLLHFL